MLGVNEEGAWSRRLLRSGLVAGRQTSFSRRRPLTAVAPPPPGQEVPRGHDECLHDKAFVFTGHLPSLKREEAKDLVCRWGRLVA